MNIKKDNLLYFFSAFEKLNDNDKLLFILKLDSKYEDQLETEELIIELSKKFSEVNAYSLQVLNSLGKKDLSNEWKAFKNEIFQKYNALENKYVLEKDIYKLGPKLKSYRLALNYSLEEFSKKSEIPISTIKKIENYGRLLGLKTMQKYVNLGLGRKVKIDFI